MRIHWNTQMSHHLIVSISSYFIIANKIFLISYNLCTVCGITFPFRLITYGKTNHGSKKSNRWVFELLHQHVERRFTPWRTRNIRIELKEYLPERNTNIIFGCSSSISKPFICRVPMKKKTVQQTNGLSLCYELHIFERWVLTLTWH